MIIRMLPIIIRRNGVIFVLLWMKQVYGVSEEGRMRLGCKMSTDLKDSKDSRMPYGSQKGNGICALGDIVLLVLKVRRPFPRQQETSMDFSLARIENNGFRAGTRPAPTTSGEV